MDRRCRKAACLLAGSALTMLPWSPLMAQETSPEPSEEASGTSANAIVVTGSRIARRDFEANSPIVTVDEDLFEQSSSAAIETSLNKLPQFTPAQTPTLGGDIQPTATNTPGAATVSLRGIGANRNLVLLDGRRSTPSNASGVTDITTIPSAAIQRVEVISGGASATYGADAVAGVTNFILKKDFQGLELDGRVGISQEGDGLEYQFSGIMGTDFADSRGNVSLAMSVNTREASYQRDRSWYQELFRSPLNGGTALRLDQTGIPFTATNSFSAAAIQQVFPGADPAIPANSTIYATPDGQLFTGNTFASRGGAPFFAGPLDGTEYKVTAAGTIAKNDDELYLVLPLTRYNFLARGNYEINDWIGVFAQGLFSHVKTRTLNAAGPITGGWGASIPYGNRIYLGDETRGIASSLNDDGTTHADYLAGGRYGLDCPATGGCPTYMVFPVPADMQTLLLSRADPEADYTLNAKLPVPRETFTDVTTYNILAGLEGTIPGTDWTWEAYVNHGVSSTFAQQTGIFSLERLRDVLTTPNYGHGFERTGNEESGGFGASTATCATGLDFWDIPAGGFSADCLEAIGADLKNRSSMRQTIAETNFQGKLLDLPAGELRAAVGASYRELDYEFLNDTLTTEGRSFLDQALGIYPSGNSFGAFDVKEVYGELLIPVLHDIPLVDAFNLEVGGRMSDYSTTGTSYTFKVLGDWEVTSWLRFRGGFNRAERAPNIGELFLAPQQTLGTNNAGDVCSTGNPNSFSANRETNPNAANVEAVCRIMMNRNDPSGQTEFNYYGGGPNNLPPSVASTSTATGGFAFPTVVGNPDLSPEKADTWTVGMVLSSPFNAPLLSGLRLTVDWFKIRVEDAIGIESVGVAQQKCFDPFFNPAIESDPVAAAESAACQAITRNIPDGNLGNVEITYANNGRFQVQGIDAALDWSFDAGPGRVTLNALVNYLIDFKSAELPTEPMTEYAGTFGTSVNGLNQGAFRYRTLTTLGYSLGPARIALQWQHLPSVEDSAEANLGTETPTTGAPSYDIFHLNGSYQLSDDVRLRFGVDNLFNKAPPLTMVNTANTSPETDGQLPGGTLNGRFYDTIGRSFYIGANVRF